MIHVGEGEDGIRDVGEDDDSWKGGVGGCVGMKVVGGECGR